MSIILWIIFWVSAATLLVFTMAGPTKYDEKRGQDKVSCLERGGVPVMTDRELLCFSKDAFK